MDKTARMLCWYDDIRSIVSDCITSEEDRMPSHTSMWVTLVALLLLSSIKVHTLLFSHHQNRVDGIS